MTPHFPPSNLAGVHRSRLFARYLPEFGWDPVIVTAHHRHYEEALDWRLAALVDPGLRVERVGALPTRPLRVVGDIGIRAFFPLLRRILSIVDNEGVDFLYVTAPSFYGIPLGRIVHALRGLPYGVDYQDPWVHAPPGSKRPLTKAWLSRLIAVLLESPSIRRATLITGVAESYYRDVLVRNQSVTRRVVTAAMPIGGEALDHQAVKSAGCTHYVFDRDSRFHFVYAGALLPHAHGPLKRIFRAIAANRSQLERVAFHFIGTGKSPNDPSGYNIRPLAEHFGLWESVVTEHPSRIPYLDVLAHLEAATAVFILGSTEPHYTPSKVYQAVLSGKPIFAVLHQASTACEVIRDTGAGHVLDFDGADGLDVLEATFIPRLVEFMRFSEHFDPGKVNKSRFDAYSARSVTAALAAALDRAVGTKCRTE